MLVDTIWTNAYNSGNQFNVTILKWQDVYEYSIII